MKKIFSLICIVFCACVLCSCGEKSEFLKKRDAALSKSGIVYHSTYFVDTDASGEMPVPVKSGNKYAFEFGGAALTEYVLEDARTPFEADEGKFLAPAKYGGEWGYLLLDASKGDTVLDWFISPQFENAESFTECYAAIERGGKYGLIDWNGDTVFDFIYDDLRYMSFGYIPAKYDGEWYIENIYEETIYGPFDDAQSYEYGYAAVCRDGKWAYIDKNGQAVTPFIYDEAWSVNEDRTAYVMENGKWKKIDLTSK